ncbi:Na+/H+ antiporter subunit E [Bacillus horti]|uniref:Multicomponent Na+:H+ antiporter subunit E n=1 Tax=Caldalkalibacillus horti TaxID=77523 RepID=A0ABT9VXE6_9BACI|nr:Na+/H+ antiporter subunit E [Bacillus horti]MDQ0165648.1 multicomponent Na+:H+ antiporter subunit E [Bacillus horti]
MILQLVFNIGLAVTWMLLRANLTVVDFVVGYLLGALLLIALQKILPFKLYFPKVIALLKLTWIFARELYYANIDVLKIVTRPKIKTTPGIIAYPTELKTDLEKTLIASLISLTPGTMPIAFSDDGKIIYVHCINMKEKDEIVGQIQETFEKAIMEVTK